MKNRIYELAKQAEIIQFDTLPSGARTPDYESVVKAKKFAELILKNCINVLMQPEHAFAEKAEDLSEYNQGWISGRLLGAEQIKEYFGVEE